MSFNNVRYDERSDTLSISANNDLNQAHDCRPNCSQVVKFVVNAARTTHTTINKHIRTHNKRTSSSEEPERDVNRLCIPVDTRTSEVTSLQFWQSYV